MVFTIPMALKMWMMVMAFSTACTFIVQNANKSDCCCPCCCLKNPFNPVYCGDSSFLTQLIFTRNGLKDKKDTFLNIAFVECWERGKKK